MFYGFFLNIEIPFIGKERHSSIKLQKDINFSETLCTSQMISNFSKHTVFILFLSKNSYNFLGELFDFQ